MSYVHSNKKRVTCNPTGGCSKEQVSPNLTTGTIKLLTMEEKSFIQIIYVSASDTAYTSIEEARALTEGYVGGRFILDHQDSISTLTTAEIDKNDVEQIKKICSQFGIIPMFVFLESNNQADVCIVQPKQLA